MQICSKNPASLQNVYRHSAILQTETWTVPCCFAIFPPKSLALFLFIFFSHHLDSSSPKSVVPGLRKEERLTCKGAWGNFGTIKCSKSYRPGPRFPGCNCVSVKARASCLQIRGSDPSTQHVLITWVRHLAALQTQQWGCHPQKTNRKTSPWLACLFYLSPFHLMLEEHGIISHTDGWRE